MSDFNYQGIENTIQKGASSYPYTQNKDDLFYYRRFYQNTEQLILTDIECAEFFLNNIKSGNYILDDINPLNAILELFSKIKEPYSKYGKLKALFIETLDYIENNIAKVTNVEQLELKDYNEDLGFYYSVGLYPYLANSISIIRSRAFAEYIRIMASHLKKSPDITNLWGGNYLIVSNVKIEDMEKWFGEIKPDNEKYARANFIKISEGKWSFILNDLGPENNYIYMNHAYSKIADLLAYVLDAEVELCTWLDD
jgi:hypothetical protein